MGSHSLQAVALTVFLTAATVFSAGIAMSGNILLILVGVGAFALSGVLFARCKRLEDSQG